MRVFPINSHVLIEPAKEETAFSSSQQTYEERGKVLELPLAHGSETSVYGGIKKGDYVYFDSWVAARYKDAEGNEHWVVPFDHIRAVEKP